MKSLLALKSPESGSARHLARQSACLVSGQMAPCSWQYASQFSPQRVVSLGLPPPGAAAGQNLTSLSTLAASFA